MPWKSAAVPPGCPPRAPGRAGGPRRLPGSPAPGPRGLRAPPAAAASLPVVAPRLEIGPQPLGVVGDLGLQRRRIDGPGSRASPGGRRGPRCPGRGAAGSSPSRGSCRGCRSASSSSAASGPRSSSGPSQRQQVGQAPRLLRPAGEQAERQDAHGVERVLRALRLGVEPADRLDRVAEEVEPHRRLLARREEVDDAAAHREVADLVDQVGAAEAEAHQALGQLVERDGPRPGRIVERRGGEVFTARGSRRNRARGVATTVDAAPDSDPVERRPTPAPAPAARSRPPDRE